MGAPCFDRTLPSWYQMSCRWLGFFPFLSATPLPFPSLIVFRDLSKFSLVPTSTFAVPATRSSGFTVRRNVSCLWFVYLHTEPSFFAISSVSPGRPAAVYGVLPLSPPLGTLVTAWLEAFLKIKIKIRNLFPYRLINYRIIQDAVPFMREQTLPKAAFAACGRRVPAAAPTCTLYAWTTAVQRLALACWCAKTDPVPFMRE